VNVKLDKSGGMLEAYRMSFGTRQE